MLIKYLYVVFIAVLISLFVGVGVAAFYPTPKSPDTAILPSAPYTVPLTASESAQIIEQNKQQEAVWQIYQEKFEVYNRNVALITLSSALFILIVSFILVKYLELISEGFLLGGLFTLIYSIFRSFASRDFKFMFIVVSVGLIIAFFLGYSKFLKKQKR